MLVIIGASGKLGFATLNALLNFNLMKPEDIVVTTSSSGGAQKLEPARVRGVKVVKDVHWDDQSSFEKAIPKECDKLFLISSARIQRDYGNKHPPNGQGREGDHVVALKAAQKQGVKHVYYTSLAFANPSKSRVMTAHERTEEWLQSQSDTKYTLIREGLYNESWPLYLGHWKLDSDDQNRDEVKVAGDGKISWTSIPDLGLATALVLAAPSSEWAGQVPYLSQRTSYTLAEVADMVSKARGREVKLNVVSRDEHVKHHVKDRGLDEGHVNWWSYTFDALKDAECDVKDPTLERLLESKGVKAKGMEETVREMAWTSNVLNLWADSLSFALFQPDFEFKSINGQQIASKDLETDITRIPVEYLTKKRSFQSASVAKRMNRACGRNTTRTEDEAYALLGLLGVNTPLLYGEGKKSFERLQYAIISQSDDETVFAWLAGDAKERRGMLARSPAEFAYTGHIQPIHCEHKRSTATFSSRGLAIDYAYSPSLIGRWDRLCQTLFGGPLSSASQSFRLQLDCELVAERGSDYSVGTYLHQDRVTGKWYGEQASDLFYMRQNGDIKKLYPAFVGWKTIYVKEPEHWRNDDKAFERATTAFKNNSFSRCSRPIWISLLWQAADLLSSASC